MRLLLLLILLPGITYSQTLTLAQQKALNNYVDHVNQSADEVTAVVKSIMDYYPSLSQKNGWTRPRYTCPNQPEDYYLKKALNESKVLGAMADPLNEQLKKFNACAEKIDQKCKALDTYHKLEDYKQDNFEKAKLLIYEIQLLLTQYRDAQASLESEVVKTYKRYSPGAIPAYEKTSTTMREHIGRERSFIDLWKYNLNENVHTGWITDALAASILRTDADLAEMKKANPVLNYPASSMWPAFKEAMYSLLEAKRRGQDEYNPEARRSDRHSNGVYLELINYFNGALIAAYNNFIDFAVGDRYYALKVIKYVPLFELRSKPETQAVSVKPFRDIPYTPLSVPPRKVSIPKPVFASLRHYIDYINETYRSVSMMRDVIRNLNLSAAYYKGLATFTGHGGLSFDNKDFTMPLSYYQKMQAESKSLDPAYAKTLNGQAEVILDILKEMEQLSIELESEVSEKRYEKDHLKHLYEILERYAILFDSWDKRKEMLYHDVRAVYASYTAHDPSDSWWRSGEALLKLTDLDRDALFKAKAFYSRGAAIPVATDRIDSAVREVIAREYDNMKGIEKIGRSNGLCPYTPYEDLPVRSRSLSELLKQLKPAKKNDNSYSHPYHSMVYSYNDVVRHYNKFCSLSPVPLLPAVLQPELFSVAYPEPVQHSSPTKQQQPQQMPAAASATNEQKSSPATPSVQVIRDTVYIEKRDTVYLLEQDQNLHSMEGYAINNMVLLLDVSGSMNAPEKLPLLKQSVINLLSMMRQEDEVSIIVFSGKPKVLLQPSSFRDENKIRSVINELKPSGKTDGNAGVKLAYKVADGNYIRGGNNRIVLATDGEFPLHEETIRLVEKFSKEDIFLSVFNFGKTVASAKNLERLCALGKGNYEYITKQNAAMKLISEVKAKRQK